MTVPKFDPEHAKDSFNQGELTSLKKISETTGLSCDYLLGIESRKFMMTKQEVEYFLKNIEHEYISRENYYETSNLIKRMRDFVEQVDELAKRDNSPT